MPDGDGPFGEGEELGGLLDGCCDDGVVEGLGDVGAWEGWVVKDECVDVKPEDGLLEPELVGVLMLPDPFGVVGRDDGEEVVVPVPGGVGFVLVVPAPVPWEIETVPVPLLGTEFVLGVERDGDNGLE